MGVAETEKTRAVTGQNNTFAAPGKRKKKMPWRIIAGVLVLAIIGSVAYATLNKKTPSATIEYEEVAAERRDIETTLSYTGTLQPLDQYEVTALVQGEVLTDNVEEGITVNEGDVLYQIDTDDAQNTIDKVQLSVEKAQRNYDETLKTLDNLTVTSDTAGMVKTMYVEVGDKVQQGTKIADILDSTTMTLKVPFNTEDAQSFWVGQDATVTMSNSFETLNGTITKISAVDEVLDGYMLVRYVTIQVSNPGGLSADSYATAMVNGAACNSGANFSYNAEKSVTAETSGEVATINKDEGDWVSAGGAVVTLTSDSIDNQIKDAQSSLSEAQLSLQNAYDTLDNYSITAPIDGTVITKNVKGGDNLDNNNTKTMCIIYDLSKLTFDMSVDELDVSNLQVGMKVDITTDALENQTFTGYITNISISGTTQNSVTTYPVTVTIDDYGGLIPGMNINAEIITASAENVVAIPASAVQRGNIVYVKEDSQSASQAIVGDSTETNGKQDAPTGQAAPSGEKPAGVTPGSMAEEEKTSDENSSAANTSGKGSQKGGNSAFANAAAGNAPDGYVAVSVELGISDDSYVEITSGLVEGDVVGVSTVKSDSATTTATTGGMSGMGGGMPTGGGMDGGMPTGGGGAGMGGAMR